MGPWSIPARLMALVVNGATGASEGGPQTGAAVLGCHALLWRIRWHRSVTAALLSARNWIVEIRGGSACAKLFVPTAD